MIFLQIRQIGVVPPLVTLFAKSPDDEKYSLEIDEIIVGAAPVSHEVETVLMTKFPRVKIRQGNTSPGCTDDGKLTRSANVFRQTEVCILVSKIFNLLATNDAATSRVVIRQISIVSNMSRLAGRPS